MKTLLILLLSSSAALAQNFAVLTYEFAQPKAVADGCPKDWVFAKKDIGKATELPPELSSPWKVMTKEQLEASEKSLEAAKEAYNNRETDDARDRRQALDRIITDFKAVRDAQSNLSAAQVTAVLKEIVTVLLKMIEEERKELK